MIEGRDGERREKDNLRPCLCFISVHLIHYYRTDKTTELPDDGCDKEREREKEEWRTHRLPQEKDDSMWEYQDVDSGCNWSPLRSLD